jgi:hypothetical protein
LGEASTNAGPKLSLKNAFEHNFSAFVKMKFSSQKQASHIIFAITIPTQLTESKSEAQKLLNDHHKVLAQTSLVSRGINEMFEWHDKSFP